MTAGEIAYLAVCPAALNELANYHDMRECEADAMGSKESAEYHRCKRLRYRELAARNTAIIESGEWPDDPDELAAYET